MDVIADRLKELIDRLTMSLEPLGVKTGPELKCRHHILTFWHPDIDASVLELKLRERGFVVAARQGMVRVSPHFYNTTDEIDEFANTVESIIDRHRLRLHKRMKP